MGPTTVSSYLYIFWHMFVVTNVEILFRARDGPGIILGQKYNFFESGQKYNWLYNIIQKVDYN